MAKEQTMFRAVFFVLQLTVVSVGATEATLSLPDGSRYTGPLKDGLMHGSGTLVWRNGDRYEGDFTDGQMHGTGEYFSSAGEYYMGEWEHGEQHGPGVVTYGDGSRYEGSFVQGYPGGHGSLDYVTGERYVGEFANGHPSGTGTLTLTDGASYVGDFENGVEHGQGVMSFANGSVYSGVFEKRVFVSGRWEDGYGNAFEGRFENWTPSGEGAFTTQDGVYRGNFENGYLMSGVHERPDGGRYEGEFDGYYSYHGTGRLEAADGTVSEGQFSYGDYVGPSTAVSGLDQAGKMASDSVHASKPANPIEVAAEKGLYNQIDLLNDALADLAPQNPDQIDVFVVQVAGDGTQEVFRREVEYAKSVFENFWQAKSRVLTLANSRKTIEQYPLATRESLRRTLSAVAQKMDRDQDILFLYMTSHGSSDFEFSFDQYGIDLPDLHASELAEMLSSLELEHTVAVVSACYSGGFIPFLKNEQTLIITAARADRLSFGCADENEMTDFGRALLVEALPNSDNLFEAFEIAKQTVTEWESVRDLTPSEPQIHRADAVEAQLKKLRAQADRS